LCLGEAVIDLICQRPVSSFSEADAFVPHLGGTIANAAVYAARHGAAVGLAGGVGADPWGSWILDRLAAEGVDTAWLKVINGPPTPLACIILNAEGEPTYNLYGEAITPAIEALGPCIEQAVSDFDALYFGSNTLVGDGERVVTERARLAALETGRPVIIDANLRLERWPDVELAIQAVHACIPGARLLRTNRNEAEVLTGCADPQRATEALLRIGAEAVVISLGDKGALLAGEYPAVAQGILTRVCSTIGAGDAFTGVLLAALTRANYQIESLVEALPTAVAEGARATERWEAVGIWSKS
jgi:fructokinase